MFQFKAPPPLSLYIHFPWCLKKCPYCDFNSHAVKGSLPETEYIQALLKDLDNELPGVWGRTVQSIFMGGGTPSLISAEAIDLLLSGIRARLPLKPGAEITLEANPGSAEQQRFSGYRQAGVNRLSIGVQSFSDQQLHNLGRVHDAAEAHRAAQAARDAGFDNFNLDLMFGLPGQTESQAMDDLQQAIQRPCPSRYLVAEWITISAPSARGRCSAGVQKQLSTTSKHLLACARSASAAISATSVNGFEGVSRNSRRVSGRMAVSQADRSSCATKVVSIPNLLRKLLNSRVVLPNILREETTWSPACNSPAQVA